MNKKPDILKICKTLQKLKEELPDFAVKMFKTISVFGVMSRNSSARLEKFRWPVMIVKLRKGQK